MAKITFAMGPKRPDAPGQQIQNVLRNAARAVLGDRSTVRITSGTGAHGSARHRAGHAADVQFLDSRGKLVTLSDPRARQIMLSAASYGALGMGAGTEYMGPHTFHVDVYPLKLYTKTMGRAWGSWGNRLESEFIAAGQGKRPNNPTEPVTRPDGQRTPDSGTDFTEAPSGVERDAISMYSPLEQNALGEFDAIQAAQEHVTAAPLIEIENLLELYRGPS